MESPAWKLTAECIWNSFRISGKRHLLLTGSPGSGKTTLLSRLAPSLPGVTTWAVPGNGVYLRENATHRQCLIGLYNPMAPGPREKMQPVPAGFTELGIPVLRHCAQCESPWISLDEIGYLELSSREYWLEIQKLLEKKRVIAAVRKSEHPLLRGLLQREDAFCLDLDAPFGKAGCVIMASGLGRRFGGGKLLAPFAGKPMLNWILDATDGLFSRRVVVTRDKKAADYCQALGVEALLHDLPHRSDTVRLGLEAVGGVERCLFCPADQPLLRPGTIMSLLLCGVQEPEAIWRPSFGGTPGAPILFPSWLFPELASLPANKGGSFLAAAHPEQVRLLPLANPLELRDVDTQEDLNSLEPLA